MSLFLEPDAPTDIHFTNVTEDSAVMMWFAPRAKITGYRLFLTVEGSTPKQLRLPSRLTQYTLLNPYTEYTATLHSEQDNTLSEGETAVFTTSECFMHAQTNAKQPQSDLVIQNRICVWFIILNNGNKHF